MMKQPNERAYTDEELEKAAILDAYERMLLGEPLSDDERRLAQSGQYGEELVPLKKMIKFARQALDSVAIVPKQEGETANRRRLMALVKQERNLRLDQERTPVSPIWVFAPAFSVDQAESVESDLVPYEYEEEEANRRCNAIVRFNIIRNDGEVTEHRPIGIVQSVTLGRGSRAQLRLSDPSNRMSRVHAKLEFADGEVHITDLGSRNGTSVNGMQIQGAVLLKAGDRVKLGEVTLEILAIT